MMSLQQETKEYVSCGACFLLMIIVFNPFSVYSFTNCVSTVFWNAFIYLFSFQINAEFKRITTMSLQSRFLSQIDLLSDKLLKVFQKRGGEMGRRLQTIMEPMAQVCQDLVCVYTFYWGKHWYIRELGLVAPSGCTPSCKTRLDVKSILKVVSAISGPKKAQT